MIARPYYPPIGTGGTNYPPYFPGNFPGNYGSTGFPSFPPPYFPPWGSYPSFNQNLPDATVGQNNFLWFQRPEKGYGIDLNGDGQYQAGQDGVLAFDTNKDGKLSKAEIEKSREMLKAFGGNYDFNNDGKVGFWERIKGNSYSNQMKKKDLDGDGRLSSWELNQAGAKVGIDYNGDGKMDQNETFGVNNFPTSWFGRGGIGYVDPRFNYTQVNNYQSWYPQPYYGGYQ